MHPYDDMSDLAHTEQFVDISSGRCSVKIYPRRKGGAKLQQADKSGPIIVTKSLLNRLSYLSLNEAASLLGISQTALKSACRKIGIRKWPSKDRAGATCQSASIDESAVDAQGPETLDLEYDGGDADPESPQIMPAVSEVEYENLDFESMRYSSPTFHYNTTTRSFGSDLRLEVPEISLPELM
mmetsp:Transcript_4039/g.11654  ORF Transcript_4039/g.11654 Transcript_4039/m.11654 type:complete len:183 (-) Transcript_4039:138-686(-)|eukprot:CAMPEP_0113672890 /NCGR_PEP_ID=MMETSP0038_2-20120614/6535_1 /TAXON_ID=2898 /ORGANISM="Cryptomonas paramecium" /LENGTH=182 /DNA_ID=CAMNT_0000589251 /DNA_START=182 /DNA_END=730 /DNA_ORIENTATION=+ /assembly_acc=CAM_ASM_000170